VVLADPPLLDVLPLLPLDDPPPPELLGVEPELLEGLLGLGPAAGLPEGPGLPAVLPLVLGLAPDVLPDVLPLGLAPMVEELPELQLGLVPVAGELGLAPIVEELPLELPEVPGLGLELGVDPAPGVSPPLEPPLAPPAAPPAPCANAIPPIARAAAAASVVRVFLLVVMSCSFT